MGPSDSNLKSRAFGRKLKLRVLIPFFSKMRFRSDLLCHGTVWFGRRIKIFRRSMPFVPLTFLRNGGANFSLRCDETFNTRVLFLTFMKTSQLIFGAKQAWVLLLSEQTQHFEHCAYIYCNMFRPFISALLLQ
jgi:hypothetical protein